MIESGFGLLLPDYRWLPSNIQVLSADPGLKPEPTVMKPEYTRFTKASASNS